MLLINGFKSPSPRIKMRYRAFYDALFHCFCRKGFEQHALHF
jgi:hypothetical protein